MNVLDIIQLKIPESNSPAITDFLVRHAALKGFTAFS